MLGIPQHRSVGKTICVGSLNELCKRYLRSFRVRLGSLCTTYEKGADRLSEPDYSSLSSFSHQSLHFGCGCGTYNFTFVGILKRESRP